MNKKNGNSVVNLGAGALISASKGTKAIREINISSGPGGIIEAAKGTKAIRELSKEGK